MFVIGDGMPLKELTTREQKVLRLLSSGKTNKQIALDMYVCEKTVEYHLGNLYTKTGSRTRVAAVVWAIQNGVIVE
jgi:DNA-binding NarL/FixJ family response regulator